MGAPPNEVYTAFSFIGFVMCAIPFYWHLEAWNTGTCLYMFWSALGCLSQCINSIVWNKNMVLRAPVYCDITTRIQVCLNVAIPAASLCINRRLYKIATIKTVTVTDTEKRRAIITDLVIGLGIPFLQMIAQYIVSFHRYTIFEDVGPMFSNALVIETVFLFSIWPLLIGSTSLFYCLSTIYTLFKRERQFGQIMSSNRNLNRGRYYRLMALSFMDVLFTIPLASYVLVTFIKYHPRHWQSWAKTHSNGHYSVTVQVPASIWRAIPLNEFDLEAGRWFVVLGAFIFFAFFGFADEARLHYRLAFRSIASRVGYSTSSVTFQGSSNVTSSLPYMTNKGGEVSVSVVTTRGRKRDSIDSFSDQLSIPSISIPGDDKADFKIEEFSPSGSMSTSSTSSLGPQGTSHEPVVTLPALPATSVPPHHADSIEVVLRGFSIDAVNAV